MFVRDFCSNWKDKIDKVAYANKNINKVTYTRIKNQTMNECHPTVDFIIFKRKRSTKNDGKRTC